MYDYIKGEIVELSPAELVLECGGIGYYIMISLQTYESLKGNSEAKVYIYHHLREDDEQFYGFATKNERELFKLLISVSGIGVGSARMMLSSLTDEEISKSGIDHETGSDIINLYQICSHVSKLRTFQFVDGIIVRVGSGQSHVPCVAF